MSFRFIVLQEKPDDKEAFHCKVISLIHQSYFREAVDVINSAPKKGYGLILIVFLFTYIKDLRIIFDHAVKNINDHKINIDFVNIYSRGSKYQLMAKS